MENIIIRKVSLADLEQLQKTSRQTFFETFSSSNTEENMNQYLAEGFSLEKLSGELSHENSEFYFALAENRVIGYLKVNRAAAQTELREERSLEIERIYVLKEFHGKKIGQLLFAKALEIAKRQDADCLWLGVWEENSRAIRFYKKNGFVEFDTHIFKLGDDKQTDIMMRLKLR